MKYTRITIKFEDYEDRFNRTFLVKSNIDLFKFGAFLGYIINSTFEHSFYIESKDEEYVPSSLMDTSYKKTVKYMGKYHLKDLPSSFSYTYDLGDDYKFKCLKREKEIELDSRKTFILEDAKGQGIWEDNIYSLRAYLDGKIDPNLDHDDEINGYYLPWNFNNQYFKDFDKEIDITKVNKNLCSNFSYIFNKLKKIEESYINYYNLDLDDIPPNDYLFINPLNKI